MRLARQMVRRAWLASTVPWKWAWGRRMMNRENGWKAAALRATTTTTTTTTRAGTGESDDEEETAAFLIGEWADFSTPWETSRQEPRTLPALPRSTKNWKVNKTKKKKKKKFQQSAACRPATAVDVFVSRFVLDCACEFSTSFRFTTVAFSFSIESRFCFEHENRRVRHFNLIFSGSISKRHDRRFVRSSHIEIAFSCVFFWFSFLFFLLLLTIRHRVLRHSLRKSSTISRLW